MEPVLYLDIDGTLLVRRGPGVFDSFAVAPGCLEFLEWATTRFRCRWLSSRCRAGWPDGARRAFRLAGASLDDPRWDVLDLIKPALWTTSKTDAIDPESDFWWLDNAPTEAERDWLRHHRREDRLVEIDLDHDVDALTQAHVRLCAAIDADR